MIHYTLNTGHSRVSPADEVDESAVRTADRLIQPTPQRLPEPFNDYELSCAWSSNLHGIRATLSFVPSPAASGGLKRPCVEFGVVADDATAKVVWPGLESLYLRLTELPGLRAADFVAPKQPATTP